jgi:hypothetical protein
VSSAGPTEKGLLAVGCLETKHEVKIDEVKKSDGVRPDLGPARKHGMKRSGMSRRRQEKTSREHRREKSVASVTCRWNHRDFQACLIKPRC